MYTEHIGKFIFMAMVILIAVGIVMIYSASGVYAFEKYGDTLYFLKKHLLFLAIGIGLMSLTMLINYRFYQPHSRLILLFSMLMLVAVFLPGIGRHAGGAQRWINLRFIIFQPVELVKICFVIYVADFLSRKKGGIRDLLSGTFPLLFITGLLLGMILLQPDMGSAVLIGLIMLSMLFVAGIDIRYVAGLCLLAVPAVIYLACSAGYRKRRLLAFLNPWADPRNTGFQIVQSFIALGSGGLFGVGLGCSRQKLFYLPHSHTDFIYSIIGEELGLAGTLSVLILFGVILWEGLRAAFKTQDLFGKYLAFGITVMITVEALINIGVSSGALPTKGLPLPFISYGGSSLAFHMASIGILLNITKDL